jgi:hypothetical protein
MRALVSSAILTCVFSFVFACSAKTAKPSSDTTNTQSSEIQAAKIGDSCTFRSNNDVEPYPNCILRDSRGKRFIAPDYVKKLEFDSHGLAVVFDNDHANHGWTYVDQRGCVLVQGVPISDNWADEFSNGLVRTVINEKYGFANRQGRIVVLPKYDWASPFKHGYAAVCIGCREACAHQSNGAADSLVDCEHRIVTGGDWFKINKAGRVVARIPQ